MIVNPVRYGGGKPKQAEVTYTSKAMRMTVWWMDTSCELQETKAQNGTIYPIAGSLILFSFPSGLRTVTNATAMAEGNGYVYRADT